MAGGASTTNMNDIFYAAEFEAAILDELRPALTSREFLRWGPKGKSKSFSFSLMDDPGAAEALTEGTDYTTVTDLTTAVATANAAEVGLATTVSDVLIEVSLLDALPYCSSVIARSVSEKWETDVAALIDDFTNVTTAASVMTPSDFLKAVSALEQRDIPGPFVGYLHPKQTGEIRAELVATTAIFDATQAGGISGPNTSGMFGTLYGVPIYQTSLVVSTSGLRGGAVFAKGAALGAYELWAPRVEVQRFATLRGYKVVGSACYGLIEVSDTRGQTLKSVA